MNDDIEITEEQRWAVEAEANRKSQETGCTCRVHAYIVNNRTRAAKIETRIDNYDRFCPVHNPEE